MSLIDKRIQYSFSSSEKLVGKVIDKIDMTANLDAQFAITGYLVEDEKTGIVRAIQNWRVLRLMPKDTSKD